jgi:hypothetical protein
LCFTPIAAIGTYIFASVSLGLFTVPLLFPFKWHGLDDEYSAVSVTPNGAIFLGNPADCPVWCQYDLVKCCESFPIGELSSSRIPRIALAQQELEGTAYYATIGDTFVISFENARFFAQVEGSDLNFQVALYADGRVELRWGEGSITDSGSIASGLEDFDLAVPATGAPFEAAVWLPLKENDRQINVACLFLCSWWELHRTILMRSSESFLFVHSSIYPCITS